MSAKTEKLNAQKPYFMYSFSCCNCTTLHDLILLPVRSMYSRKKSTGIARDELRLRLKISELSDRKKIPIISFRSTLSNPKGSKESTALYCSLYTLSLHMIKSLLCTAIDLKIFGDGLVCQCTEYSAHSNGFAKVPRKESSSCTTSITFIRSIVI